jgi:hypothetical protein
MSAEQIASAIDVLSAAPLTERLDILARLTAAA